uniref:HAT C-terminal dimerisation domain-containing protein n=1 Tax=Chenopodium quinoa TaxID=63459 RepID=A0A803NCA5_CHEQI
MFKACQRISVTTDTWTSIQRINYMCLTAHFIDKHWGIEDKLFIVTIDNASSNDVACMHLSRMVRRTGCINDGKNLHVRCMAHIINLIVWDGIKQHGVCIDRVRNAVKHVKNSPARISRFKDLVQKANIDSKASLSFDVHTRWNSTFTMLDTALKFQRVFRGLSLPDGGDLNDNERPPEEEDRKKVQRLTLFLKGYYVLTKRISGSHYVTSNKEGGDYYMKNLKEVAKKLEGTSGYVMNELDRFLHERIGPEEEELDALTWWGINGHRYSVLKSMARDILAVPLSTVASESAFSMGGRTLDPFRSSLTPKTLCVRLPLSRYIADDIVVPNDFTSELDLSKYRALELGMFYNYSYVNSDNTSFGFDVRVIDNPVFRTKPSFPHEYKVVLFMNPNCETGHPRLDDFMVVELSNEIALTVKSVKSGEKRKVYFISHRKIDDIVQAEKIDAHVFALPSDRRLSQSATRVDKSKLYCFH